MKNASKRKLLLTIFYIILFFFSPIVIVGASPFTQPETRIETQIQGSKTNHNTHTNLFIEQDNSFIIAESNKNKAYNLRKSAIFGDNLLEFLEYQNPVLETIRILIVFEEHLSHIQQLGILNLMKFESNIIKQYKNFPISLIEVLSDDLDHNEEKLSQLEGITKIYLDHSYQILAHQNYPTSANLVDEENWWLDAIGASNIAYNGSGVRIAILDTGINSEHGDFTSKGTSTLNINFVSDDGSTNQSAFEDVYGHGTHVAGIAAGTGLSSSGKYQGVAPGASLLNVKTLNDGGGITDSDVIDAIDWIITQHNADIISMSFRLDTPNYINPVSIAFETAAQSGITLVTSGGNYGPDYYSAIPPATNPSIISVGAINRELKVSSYSSLGPSPMSRTLPDVLAPGTDIIAAESANSIIAYKKRYTNSQILGSLPNSDYVALSGTSMAAPMVAGAIAILLEAYPTLTPEGIRAALYHGAYLPNHYAGKYGANGIGAGIINVSASLAWLDSLSDPNNIIQAYPDSLPYEPVDLLAYPGDFQSFNISLLSSHLNPITVNITLPNSPSLEVTSSADALTFSNHSVQHLEFTIKILENATVGLDTGVIFVNDSITGDVLEEIEYSVNVTYPNGRVYFDPLHGLNDVYPMWPSGFSQIEIYEAMKLLHKEGYQLVYRMENWTIPTQSPLNSRLLTFDLLSTFDIVVLQTPIIPYTQVELDALKKYRDEGGSILILGTRHQTLAVDSLNLLLTQLNTDITINNESIFEYTDVGFGYVLDKFVVSDVDTTSPIFTSDDSFSFWYGPTLETGLNANPIASLYNQTVVASHDSISGGKVVVWSDYHWVRNDIFNRTTGQSHEGILSSLFDYMNSQSDCEYSIGVRFNSTVQSNGDDLQMYLSIINTTTNTPITDRIYGDTLNATLISPSMGKTPLLLSSLGTGLYTNTSFTLGSPDFQPYSIRINISSPTGLLTHKFALYRINDTYAVNLADPTISSQEISQSTASSNLIQYTGNTGSLTASLYGSLLTDSMYSMKPIREYTVSLNPDEMQYSYPFTVTTQDHAGLVVYFAIGTSSNNYTNFEVTRDVFRITNNEPEIDETKSSFERYAFEDTQTDESYYIIPVNEIGSLSLSVYLEESVPYEDSSNEFSVIAYYTAAVSAGSYFDILYPDYIPTSSLSFNADSDSYEGSFKIPKKLTFIGDNGPEEVSQESSDDLTYFSILWITARDTDGDSIDYFILMRVTIVFGSFLEYLPLIAIFLVITGIVVTIIIVSKKRRKTHPPSPYHTNSPSDSQEYVYCIHCGQKIHTSYQVCPHCGKSV